MLRRALAERRTVRYLVVVLILLGRAAAPAAADLPPGTQSITIDSAIARALEVDSELKNLRLLHQLDAARYRVSAREFLPRLSISYSGLDSVSYAATDSHSRRLTLGVQQLVYSAGSRIRGRKLRRMQLDIEELALLAAAERVALNVIELFADYLLLQHKNAILQQTWELSQQQREIAARELALGTVSELHYLEIDLLSQDLQLELQQARSRQRRTKVRFQQLLRIEQPSQSAPHGRIDTEFRGYIDSAAIELYRARARTDNLDILRAQKDLQAAVEQQRRARLTWLPDIRLNADVTSSADRFPLSEHGYSVGVTFDFAVPVVPAETTVSAGRQSATERSRSVSGTVRPGDNLDAIFSRTSADIEVARKQTQHDDLLQQSDSALIELAVELDHHHLALSLLQARGSVESRRSEIERLRLQLGEITRVAFLEAEIARAHLSIALTQTVVALFRTEVAILQLSGSGSFDQLYNRLIVSGEPT